MKFKFLFLPAIAVAFAIGASAKTIELLNASYDPTR